MKKQAPHEIARSTDRRRRSAWERDQQKQTAPASMAACFCWSRSHVTARFAGRSVERAFVFFVFFVSFVA